MKPRRALFNPDKVWDFQYRICRDRDAARLIGLKRDAAMRLVRGLNYRNIRIIDIDQSVNFEIVPERLTLILAPAGIVTRAFCR